MQKKRFSWSVIYLYTLRGFLCIFVLHINVHMWIPTIFATFTTHKKFWKKKCLRQRRNFTFQLKYFFVKKTQTFVHFLLPYNKAMLLCILAKVSMASEGAKKVICKINLFRYLTNRWRQRWILHLCFHLFLSGDSNDKNNLNPFHMFFKYYYIRWYFKSWWKPPLSTL